MSTSSPDAPSTTQGKKVDITFVVRDGRNMFFGENEGYTTTTLRRNWVKCKVFERLNLPDWFQLADIHTLSDVTRLLVVDCMIESSQDISEWDWLSTGLKFAEEVRKAHPDLPIWLIDPFDAGQHLGIQKRTQASQIEQVFLSNTVPSIFLEKVQAVLGKK